MKVVRKHYNNRDSNVSLLINEAEAEGPGTVSGQLDDQESIAQKGRQTEGKAEVPEQGLGVDLLREAEGQAKRPPFLQIQQPSQQTPQLADKNHFADFKLGLPYSPLQLQLKPGRYKRNVESERSSSLRADVARDFKFGLSQEEHRTFGDRYPAGFTKLKLLGKGGFALVWLAEHDKTRKLLAVKQLLTGNVHQTHLKQIWLGSFFFEKGGVPRAQFQDHPGINSLIRMVDYRIESEDCWIFYEYCNRSLSSSLYSTRLRGGRSTVEYKDYYKYLGAHPQQLEEIVAEAVGGLALLSEHNIVHSDIKTENLLVCMDEQPVRVKLIDYGSCFLYTNLKQFAMATPEYMAPEILNYVSFQNKAPFRQDLLDSLRRSHNNSAIDVWGLGAVLLEVLSGVPLWLNTPSVVRGEQQLRTGLFAIDDRDFLKIIQRQKQVVENLDHVLESSPSPVRSTARLRTALGMMLELDPSRRGTPEALLRVFGKPYTRTRIL